MKYLYRCVDTFVSFLRISSPYALLLLLTTTSFSQRRQVVVTEIAKHYSVSPYTDVLRSSASEKRIGSYINSAFRPLNISQLETGNTEAHTYWFRFTVSNRTQEHLYAVLDLVGYSQVALYEWDGHKAHFVGIAGMHVRREELYLPNTRGIFRLDLPYGQTKTYLLRTQRLWMKAFPLAIYPEYALLSYTQLDDIISGISTGIILCAFLFQLIFYWLTREKDYLLLSALGFCFLLQSFFAINIIPTYISLPSWANTTIVYTALISFTGIVSIRFQQNFLKIEQFGDRVNIIGIKIASFGYSIFLIVALLDQQTLFEWQTPYTVLVYLFTIYNSISIFKKGYRPAIYLFVNQIIPFLGIPILILQSANKIPGDFRTTLMIFTTPSFITNSLLVGYKVKQYRKEADELVRQQNRDLELLVAERTNLLQEEKQRADQQSERLQLALRELNHRVRNNLSIVSSLLKMQSSNSGAHNFQEAFRESRQRIDTMSLIHRQLYQMDELTTIELPTFITNLTHIIRESYGLTASEVRNQFDLQPINLPIEKALPIGLLLNEVLTNSFKYGLSQAELPKLTIKLFVAERIQIEVHDNGPGIDLEQWQSKTTSFGRRLIEGLCNQLNGEYQIQAQNGTYFVLHIPY